MSIGRMGHGQYGYVLRATVNYSDTNVSTGIKIGTLPAGAHIIRSSAHVRTVFNAGTTNVLTLGTNSSSYDNLLNAGAITEGTAGYYSADPNADITYPTGDLDVYVKYTQTGTAASTGKADVVVLYAIDDSQYA